MTLKLRISEELKGAMKEKNTLKLSTLRVLKAEIERNEQTSNGKIDMKDGDVIKLVKKLVESIKETTKNLDEIAILEAYLPLQLTEDQIRLVTVKLKEAGHSSLREIMKYFKTNHDGLYDGKILSNIAKEVLA